MPARRTACASGQAEAGPIGSRRPDRPVDAASLVPGTESDAARPGAVFSGDKLVSERFSHYAAAGRPASPARRGTRGGERMHFDLAAIPANEAYKLLVSTVVPRPIALATTVDANGRVNAAPFSFFNAVSSVPPVVVLGISPGDPDAPPNDGYKDTERNIRDSGEFVVNLVDEAIAERMNVCAVDFPNTVGELEHADLHPIPSVGCGRRASPNRRSASSASGSPACRSGRARRSKSAGSPYPHSRRSRRSAALLRRDREDAPDWPHAWPRLVCPHNATCS